MHKPESTQGNSVVCWNIYGTVVRTVRTTTLGIAVVVYWRALCYYDVIRKDSSVIRTAPNKNSAKRSENTKTRRHVVEALTFSCAIGFFQHCDVIIVLQYDLYVLRTSYVRWRWFACRPYVQKPIFLTWHGTVASYVPTFAAQYGSTKESAVAVWHFFLPVGRPRCSQNRTSKKLVLRTMLGFAH